MGCPSLQPIDLRLLLLILIPLLLPPPLGAGRPPFRARTTAEAESFFVESLEEWRRKQGLDKMVLMVRWCWGGMGVRCGFVWGRCGRGEGGGAAPCPCFLTYHVLRGCTGAQPRCTAGGIRRGPASPPHPH